MWFIKPAKLDMENLGYEFIEDYTLVPSCHQKIIAREQHLKPKSK